MLFENIFNLVVDLENILRFLGPAYFLVNFMCLANEAFKINAFKYHCILFGPDYRSAWNKHSFFFLFSFEKGKIRQLEKYLLFQGMATLFLSFLFLFCKKFFLMAINPLGRTPSVLILCLTCAQSSLLKPPAKKVLSSLIRKTLLAYQMMFLK